MPYDSTRGWNAAGTCGGRRAAGGGAQSGWGALAAWFALSRPRRRAWAASCVRHASPAVCWRCRYLEVLEEEEEDKEVVDRERFLQKVPVARGDAQALSMTHRTNRSNTAHMPELATSRSLGEYS
jgi:hypothetical protein